MTELLIHQHRVSVEHLIEAVAVRNPDAVAQILNPLERAEIEAVAIILADLVDPTDYVIRASIRMAARTFNLLVEDISGPSRRQAVVDARGVVCYAVRLFEVPFQRIADSVDRDTSTVMHAVGRVGENPRLRGIATGIATELGWQRPEDGAA